MPLFFALSGYLFKPVEEAATLKTWIRKRTIQLGIPYVCFVAVLLAMHYILVPPVSLHQVTSDLAGVAAGGRMIPSGLIGIYAPIWFITCLYATQILFVLIAFTWRHTPARIAAVLVAYLLAHLESWAMGKYHINIPLDLDVALMCVAYYAFGFFARPLLSMRYRPRVIAPLSLVLSTGFLIAGINGLFRYVLDLKYVGYHSLLLDLAIPLTMVVAVCVVSHAVSRLKIASFFVVLGVASLTIMYLHMYVNQSLSNHFRYGLLLYTAFGTLIPLLIWWLFLKRFSVTRRFFLGTK
jgi:fucose 4-O-acetylase-like acetyltransferase